MFRRTTFLLLLTAASPAMAQGSQGPPAANETLKLTVDEAVRLALDHNVDLAAARIDPQIGDARVAAAVGAFKPAVSSNLFRNNQLQPPAAVLTPTATRTDVMTSSIGLDQRLPWFGTSYSVSWDASRTESDSFLNTYNPLVRSGLSLDISQPLLRNLSIDDKRAELTRTRRGRDVADARLRETLVHTTAGVKRAYWNLVSALANVEARKTAVTLAEELARVNQAKVDVGQSPPLDFLAAQAEVAAHREDLIVAETLVKLAEDRLRLLIFDPTDRSVWSLGLEPIDTPPVGITAVDMNRAVSTALGNRADLSRARTEISVAKTNVEFSRNQLLPDVRINASYQASGLGGTEVLRAGGFPGTILGPGSVTNFGSVLNQLVKTNYPTWAVGVSVSYPIGRSTDEARHAQTQLEYAQAGERLKSAEARVIQQVRDAAWKIEMNSKRIDTTRVARELAEQRLDAERKRFDVGMSTSFLVIQAQRDFAQAKTNELASVLAYGLALVDFEALQEAGPAAAAQ